MNARELIIKHEGRVAHVYKDSWTRRAVVDASYACRMHSVFLGPSLEQALVFLLCPQPSYRRVWHLHHAMSIAAAMLDPMRAMTKAVFDVLAVRIPA